MNEVGWPPWLALRAERIFTAKQDGGGLYLPKPLVGVACTTFAIGMDAVAWLKRLAGSDWYLGLQPTPNDFGAAAASGTWPAAGIATVALSARAPEAEVTAALDLLAKLPRQRVIVTLGGPSSPQDALAGRLAERGAFVLRAASILEPSEIHHLPLRAATRPRGGRVVGIDLADVLALWPAGQVGLVHSVPLAFRATVHPMHEVLAGYDQVKTLFLDMHLDPADDDWTLADIDRLSNRCAAWSRGLARDRFVISSSERGDGYNGGMECVVVGTEGVSRFSDEIARSSRRTA